MEMFHETNTSICTQQTCNPLSAVDIGRCRCVNNEVKYISLSYYISSTSFHLSLSPFLSFPSSSTPPPTHPPTHPRPPHTHLSGVKMLNSIFSFSFLFFSSADAKDSFSYLRVNDNSILLNLIVLSRIPTFSGERNLCCRFLLK